MTCLQKYGLKVARFICTIDTHHLNTQSCTYHFGRFACIASKQIGSQVFRVIFLRIKCKKITHTIDIKFKTLYYYK